METNPTPLYPISLYPTLPHPMSSLNLSQGALNALGELNLRNVALRDNSAVNGGAIYAESILQVVGGGRGLGCKWNECGVRAGVRVGTLGASPG